MRIETNKILKMLKKGENLPNEIMEIIQEFNYKEIEKEPIKLNSVTKLVNYLNSTSEKDVESFKILMFNSDLRLLGIHVQKGTIGRATVYKREIIKAVLDNDATRVILSHNHPSGNVRPSGADKDLTTEIKKALEVIEVEVLDHLITSESGRYFSFLEENII